MSISTPNNSEKKRAASSPLDSSVSIDLKKTRTGSVDSITSNINMTEMDEGFNEAQVNMIVDRLEGKLETKLADMMSMIVSKVFEDITAK